MSRKDVRRNGGYLRAAAKHAAGHLHDFIRSRLSTDSMSLSIDVIVSGGAAGASDLTSAEVMDAVVGTAQSEANSPGV